MYNSLKCSLFRAYARYEAAHEGRRVQLTIDMDLQRAAEEGRAGIKSKSR